MPHLVMVGNPVDGLTCHGPFKTRDDALAWAEIAHGADWWITDLYAPEQPFTVIYTEPTADGWLFFECIATDDNAAEAQLMDAYPRASVLWINTGHGPDSRHQETANTGDTEPTHPKPHRPSWAHESEWSGDSPLDSQQALAIRWGAELRKPRKD